MLRTAKVENGLLRGLPGADPRVTVYKGVPFAAPPVGKNRWRAPQPCENWEGERLAAEFAPISVQDQPGVGTDVYCREWHVDPDIPMDEDCLYLNVWTGANSLDEKLPVLVWFFGGGFQWGYTAEMEFDGERLARRGVVVVTVNYRLAALGFLSHPEITAENPEAPANFGLLDQQAGLKWVRRNIAAFGGDPDNITIAGQSAGGASTLYQLTCEKNFEDIRRAAIFSGIIQHPVESEDIFKPISLDEAEVGGVEFFRFLGVETLEEARKLDAFYIRAKYGEYAANHRRFFPIVDGKTYVGDPLQRFIEGKRPQVPVISGYTSDEFVMNGVNVVGESVVNTFKECEENGDKTQKYLYQFGPDIPGWDNPGVFHSVDLWFFFESLGKCWRPFKGYHYDTARLMCNYFANFIKTGDPNGNDADGTAMPVWRPYSQADKCKMFFGNEVTVR